MVIPGLTACFMVSRADLTTLPTLKMPSNSSLLCMVNFTLSFLSALRAGSFFLKWTIACESGRSSHSMFQLGTCQSCGMRRLRRTMNEKYFIHLMSMQLASILTRQVRHFRYCRNEFPPLAEAMGSGGGIGIRGLSPHGTRGGPRA